MKSLNVLIEWYDFWVDIWVIISTVKEKQSWIAVKAVKIDFVQELLQ